MSGVKYFLVIAFPVLMSVTGGWDNCEPIPPAAIA
jgi:hypothetical protein